VSVSLVDVEVLCFTFIVFVRRSPVYFYDETTSEQTDLTYGSNEPKSRKFCSKSVRKIIILNINACSGLFYVIEFINYRISGNGVCQ